MKQALRKERFKVSPQWLPWLILAVLALVWGSSFILIKKGLNAFSAGEVGALRIVSAAAFLLPIAAPKVAKLTHRQLLILLIIGFVGSFIPAFLFAFAQTSISSSLTGILNALTPLCTLLLGAAFFGQAITTKSGMGLGIGFIGSLILILGGTGNSLGEINLYALLVIGATICYGLNLNIIKNYTPELHPVVITGVSLLFVGPLAAAYLFGLTDFAEHVQQPEALWPLLALVALGVIGTALALILFNKLVQMQTAVFASSVTYIIPIVAVVWGVLDGEALSIYHFLGMGAILCGVYVANRH
ncbi:DMT family transporter [Catalinimonas niigatensis]|uniref:DMT family transporter n=1 Tax=Catalinimonas niigatensis TaxID=1397264 RepID=UPI0026651806|nr:DMT family transporter [Catalinimonas niigatensis]WPP48510.1 DMT family transporter [Catalinimonas niigatensis]